MVFIIDPKLRPDEMQSYVINAPLSTHWRKATCAEANCTYYLNGWISGIDETAFPAQAYYIRHQSGRKFTESKSDDGQITYFRFEAGQNCFNSDSHKIRIPREELFILRGGDRRGNPRGTEAKQFQRPEDFVDHFANHQDQLKTILDRG